MNNTIKEINELIELKNNNIYDYERLSDINYEDLFDNHFSEIKSLVQYEKLIEGYINNYMRSD